MTNNTRLVALLAGSRNPLFAEAEKEHAALNENIANPTDMSSEKAQKRMKEVVEKATDKFSQLNDFDLGGWIRMLDRNSLLHEGLVCAARDRIYKLSLELAEAKAKIAELEK